MASPQPADDHSDQPQPQHPQPQNEIVLVADNDQDDLDSALGEALNDSLTSLRSSILEYHQENGRTYHAMSAGKYIMPNDDEEVERLDLQHHIFRLTLDDKLCLSPKNEGAKRVLDLGTGTGIWCIEYADEHPEAEVIGVDLSPVQPNLVPPNCSFEVDDIEKEWTWSKKFDLIMARMMNGSFADPAAIVKKAFDQLEPGAYFEAQDMAAYVGCDDGTLPSDSDLRTWMEMLCKAMETLGRPLTAGQQWGRFMEEAGFEDVVETVYKWPTNTWPKDRKHKTIGRWSMANMDKVLDAAALAPLTRGLGWTKDEAVVLAAKARADLKNPKIHAYWPIYIAYGRKPGKKQA